MEKPEWEGRRHLRWTSSEAGGGSGPASQGRAGDGGLQPQSSWEALKSLSREGQAIRFIFPKHSSVWREQE